MKPPKRKEKYARNDEFVSAFGKRVREIRLSQGLSQQELANKCDSDLSTVNRIELGLINTSISSVAIICDALQIHPKELFDFEISKKDK